MRGQSGGGSVNRRGWGLVSKRRFGKGGGRRFKEGPKRERKAFYLSVIVLKRPLSVGGVVRGGGGVNCNRQENSAV